MKMKNLLITSIVIFGFATISFGQTLPSYIPSEGLVGWWPFNGNANDESGNGNDGTVNGATITADRNGNANSAYSFDGVSNFIEIQTSDELNLPDSYTISVWVNAYELLGTYNDEPSILSKFNNWGNGGYTVFMGEDIGAINYCYQQYGNNRLRKIGHSIDNWYQINVVYDGVSTFLYINNELVDSLPNFGSIEPNEIPLCFGREGQIHSQLSFFHGKIDDIGIWNRALTQEEITSIYSGSSAGISDVSQSNLYSVFPNPAQSVINVNIDDKLVGSVFTIYDNIGKAVKTGKLNSSNTTIELNDLSGGTYTFNVGGNSSQTFKIIKE